MSRQPKWRGAKALFGWPPHVVVKTDPIPTGGEQNDGQSKRMADKRQLCLLSGDGGVPV